MATSPALPRIPLSWESHFPLQASGPLCWHRRASVLPSELHGDESQVRGASYKPRKSYFTLLIKRGNQSLPHLWSPGFLPPHLPAHPTLQDSTTGRCWGEMETKWRCSRSRGSLWLQAFPRLPRTSVPHGLAQGSARAEAVEALSVSLGSDPGPRWLLGVFHPPCGTGAELALPLHEGFPECFPEDIVPHSRVIRVKFITGLAGPGPTQWGKPAPCPGPTSPGKIKPVASCDAAHYQPWGGKAVAHHCYR